MLQYQKLNKLSFVQLFNQIITKKTSDANDQIDKSQMNFFIISKLGIKITSEEL